MTVLWFSHFVPWPATGHGALARSFHLVREAASRRELHLLALAPPSPTGPQTEETLGAAREGLERYCASVTLVATAQGGGRMSRAVSALAGWPSSRAYWERWYWSPEAQSQLVALQERVHPDVVHLDTVFLRPYVEQLQAPFVLNHHNVESHLLARRSANGSRAARAFYAREARKVTEAERVLSLQAETNVMVSDTDAERLQSIIPGARTCVVANGVDLDFFRLPPVAEASPREAVFLGGMDWFPNKDAMEWFATDIWPALAAAPGGVLDRMTVVGREPAPLLRTAAAADPRIDVTGFVDDVRPYVARAALFLCPMRVGGGTRLKILDALAMGRVLVSTAVGVEGIPMREGEHYLRAETPQEFVEQMTRAAGDPALRDRLGAAGRALVEREYGWAPLGDRLEAAYASAARGTRVAT